MTQTRNAKVKAQNAEFAQAEADKALYRAIQRLNVTRESNITLLIDNFLASGNIIHRCKPQKHHSESKKGGAIVGPTTNGRSELWGGRRWVYGK